MEKNTIPKATLGRLPQYLQFLRSLPESEHKTISSTALAKELSLGEVQVRKDLNLVSGAGKPKIGYVTADLINHLEGCLGYHELTPAVLVGAGKLGRALLDYTGFEEYGVEILAGFDSNEQTFRSDPNTKNILPISQLKPYCKEHHIQIGILSVGRDSAQEVCDYMIQSGITAIWNFAPCRLILPEGIRLKQENLALSLAYLNNQLCK